MNDASVIAVVGVLGTCVGGLIWTLKKVLTDITPAINKNTEISIEFLIFMKKLNGRLPKLVEDRVKQAAKE